MDNKDGIVITPDHFRQTFIEHKTGQEVYFYLVQKFEQRPSYSADSSHHTAYLEGQRSVLLYINEMLTKISKEDNTEI